MYADNGPSIRLNDEPTTLVGLSRNARDDYGSAQTGDVKTASIFELDATASESLNGGTRRTVTEDGCSVGVGVPDATLNGARMEDSESLTESNNFPLNIKLKTDMEKSKEDTDSNHSPRKNGKSPLAKKRKGGTWYSVLSPTYKSRSVEFKRFFKDLPPSERLIVDYSCALQKDLLVHGRLYVSQSYLCFHANIFRWATVLKVPFKDIMKLTKERTAKVIPNAIQVITKDDKFFFTSFSARDRLFVVLDRVWKIRFNDQILARDELCQWINYSYGEDLGLTSGDDNDFSLISPEEKLRFQLILPQNSIVNQCLLSSSVVASKEPGDNDFLLLNSGNPSNRLSVPIDASLADVLSSPLSDEQPSPPIDESSPAFDSVADDLMQLSEAKIQKELAQDHHDGHDASSDSNSDEEAVDHCCDHDHFSIDVIDEILSIPVDSVFTYCFTDSALFRDFVAAKKTFDVVLSSWPDETDDKGTKVRNISYTLSLNYSIGPKVSPSTERQIMHPQSKPGQFYLIDTECINAGIPYGENFYVINRYCISRISNNRCHFRVTSQIKYRKNVWGLVKSFIEKNVSAGIRESFSVLANLLRQESHRLLDELPAVRPCNLARKKVLRRKRASTRAAVVKSIASDGLGLGAAKIDLSVRQSISQAIVNKIQDEWHIRLTFDSIVKLIAGVLLILVFFNGILFYKLWTLEASTSTLVHSRFSHFDASVLKEPPKSNQEWLRLLDHQHMLHEAEVIQWKEILSTSIELLDQMTHTLSELRSSLDKRSLYKRDKQTNSE